MKLGIMGVVGSMPVLACSLIVYIRINLVFNSDIGYF